MKESRTLFLMQALVATFLWSASKIILKLGLGLLSPWLLIGCIQAVAFLGLLIYSRFYPIKLKQQLKSSEIYALVLLSMMGFVVAPVFSVIGLKYVTGLTAGLVAGLGSVLVVLLGWWILRERPRQWQAFGILLAVLGAYVFLGDGQFTGSLLGVFMLVLSEFAYAFNIVLTRLLMRQPGDQSLLVALIGSFMGAAILLPVGWLTGSSVALGYWQTWLVIGSVGLIFAFAGLLWNYSLNYLLSFEASVLQNTMLIQVGLLSWIFLRETIVWYHWLGAIIVLMGVYLVNRQLLNQRYASSRT
ncbi:MAG: DMT family transporter [Patescibacteria group bacterium]|jgi:drug/metabolite transporter (DMT)-like permease